MVLEGTALFSNLTKFDEYQGKSTERYTLTVALNDDGVKALEDAGVKVKTYIPEEGEPTKQRKFASKFNVRVMTADGDPFTGEVPWGSTVRLKYSLGAEHPVHGVSTYLDAVKVLEVAEGQEDDEDF